MLLLAGLWIALPIAVAEFAVRNIPLVPDYIPIQYRALPGDEAYAPLANQSVTSLYGIENHTNSLGLRGPERTLEKVPGTYRIAMLGDSVVWGYGVQYEQGMSRQLEDHLAEQGKPVEVWNLGVQASNIFNYRARYARLAPQIHPDMTFIVLLANDLADAPARFRITSVNTLASQYRMAPYPDSWRPILEQFTLFHLLVRWYTTYDFSGWLGMLPGGDDDSQAGRSVTARIVKQGQSETGRVVQEPAAHLEHMLEQLDGILAIAAEVGSEVCLCLMPGDDDPAYRMMEDTLARYARQRHVEFMPLSTVLGSPLRAEFKLPADHIHPNSEGHRRIAQILAGYVSN